MSDDPPSKKRTKTEKDEDILKTSFAKLEKLQFNQSGIVKTSKPKSQKSPPSSVSEKPLADTASTKFQAMVTEFKMNNPETFLIFQKGLRYFMYGDNARLVGRQFGKIVVQSRPDPDDPFAYTSVREENLSVLVRQLTEMGIKVGLVEQTESTIDTVLPDGKKQTRLLERKLSRIYTKGTFLDDISSYSSVGKSHSDYSDTTGCILGIAQLSQSGPLRFTATTIMAYNSEVCVEEIDCGENIMELDVFLALTEPSDVLLFGDFSPGPRQLFERYAVKKQSARLEKRKKLESNESDELLISVFYSSQKLDKILDLSENIRIVFAGIVQFLKECGVEISPNFNDSTHKHNMELSGDTLSSLGIFYNTDDYSSVGSLFSMMDHTQTVFGARLFKYWFSRPLTNSNMIEQRLDAVTELMMDLRSPLNERILSHLPDLELSITKIMSGRIKYTHLHRFLECMMELSKINGSHWKSKLLKEIFNGIQLCKETTGEFLQQLNGKAKDLSEFFSEHSPEYQKIEDCKDDIELAKAMMQRYVEELSKATGIENLTLDKGRIKSRAIRVGKSDEHKTPDDWSKVESTRGKTLYTTKHLDGQLRELELAEKALQEESMAIYLEFLKSISSRSEIMRQSVLAAASLDCLLSLATTSKGWCRPSFNVERRSLKMIDAWNPLVIQGITKHRYVKTSIHMDDSINRVSIISGPNMGGKSSYAKLLGTLALLAQTGSYVPARSAEMCLFDGIYTRMGASDSIMEGKSTFMVEMSECAKIISQATSKSLVLLDEIGRGTGSIDGAQIASAILEYFITDLECMTIFITHYPSVSDLENQHPVVVQNWRAAYKKTEKNSIELLYTMVKGPAGSSFGMNVAEMAGIPSEVTSEAHKKSLELQRRHIEIQNRALVKLLKHGNGISKMVDILLRKRNKISAQEASET